jgi:tetratricopeptide (TPR) repeat protein
VKSPDQGTGEQEALWASYRQAGHEARLGHRFAEAEQHFRDALQIAEQFGHADPRLAETLTDLALLQMGPGRRSDRASDAEAFLRRALAIREQAFGPDHPEVAQTLIHLATLPVTFHPHRRSDPAVSLPDLERAVAILERAEALDPWLVDTVSNRLENLCRGQHMVEEAEPLLRRTMAVCERHWGPSHHRISQGLAAIAQLYERQDRIGEAEALLREARTRQEQAGGAEHPGVGSALQHLVGFCLRQRRYSEAEALQRRLLPIQENEERRGNPPSTHHLVLLADLCALQGKLAEAEALLQQILARLEGTRQERDWEKGQALELYALLLKEAGSFGEALEMERRARGADLSRGDPSTEARQRVVWPPPHPDEQPEFVWIRWLTVGHVTDRDAAIRWQTTADAAVSFAHRARHGGGGASGGGRGREHGHDLQFHHPTPSVHIEAFAGSPAGVDVVMATLVPAVVMTSAGEPHLIITQTVRPLGGSDFVEVTVRFTNEGDGDVLRLRLERVEPAPGWEFLPIPDTDAAMLLPATQVEVPTSGNATVPAGGAGSRPTGAASIGGFPYPPATFPLYVGQIGPGGAGLLLVRLVRRAGDAVPMLALQGSYTDTRGVAFSL